MDHIRYKPFDMDVAAAGTATPGAAEQNRMRLDSRPQAFGENIVDELLLGLALHRHGEADHGRPPIRFFCQSSPVV